MQTIYNIFVYKAVDKLIRDKYNDSNIKKAMTRNQYRCVDPYRELSVGGRKQDISTVNSS